jgi:hypothetical protein
VVMAALSADPRPPVLDQKCNEFPAVH